MKPLKTPEQSSGCPNCQQSPQRQSGCSHVDCPRRKPWGSPVPRPQDCEPISGTGGSAFKLRAHKGAE